MNRSDALRSFFGTIMVTLLVTSSPAGAEDDLTPLSVAKPSQGWKILKHANTGAVELISKDLAGSLSAMCSDDLCAVFVEPVAGCVPGANYPVLVNSSKRVGVVPAKCATIPGPVESSLRHIVMFKEQKAMIQALMEEIDLSIAFPTQAGAMDVINVPMRGVRDLLDNVMPSLATPRSSSSTADESTRSERGGARKNEALSERPDYRSVAWVL